MCCCGKPTINGEPGYSWDGRSTMVYAPAPPELAEGDVLLADEPGRCGRGIDSHCYHFRLVENRGQCLLVVKHGAGTERIRFGWTKTLGDFATTPNADRYWVFQAAYHAVADTSEAAAEKVESLWRRAAAEKRIKTRKLPGQDAVRVTLLPALVA